MRLTAMELENFKGIGTRQRIELRPITLLFGPNSAGKSTILHALHYAREILERGDCNPDITIAGMDLGGFAQFVYRHDLQRSVVLRVEFDLEEDELPRYAALSGDERDEFNTALSPDRFRSLSEATSASVEMTMRWSKLRRTAYVASLTVGLNGRDAATITASPDGKRTELDQIDVLHPLFSAIEPKLLGHHNGLESVFPLLEQPDEEGGAATTSIPGPIKPVALEDLIDAVPKSSALLPLDMDALLATWWQAFLELGDVEENEAPLVLRGFRYEFRAAHAYVSRAIVGPIDVLRGFLRKTIHIGPLRRVPSRSYRPAKSDRLDRWWDGSTAWDQLFRADDPTLLQEVNHWLADAAGLETGYQLGLTRVREFGENLAGLEEDSEEDQSASKWRLHLTDLRAGVEVHFVDIGVGISQIVPVIVALARPASTLIAIEQPELHIHPALQVGLGDLVIAATRTASSLSSTSAICLIETHSEHIMLRLLRRIRETSEDQLGPDQPRLSNESVGVVYVQPSDDGARFTALRISSNGDFIDRWPRGFFEERVTEVF